MRVSEYISCFVVKWIVLVVVLLTVTTTLTPFIKSQWLSERTNTTAKALVKRQIVHHDVTLFFPGVSDCNLSHSALEDFPPDLFTKEQRKSGMIIIHIIVIIYLFILLATICEFYFVSCLTKMGLRLNMPMNVIGATLMAIGSSAPTLFVSIISVFFSEKTGEIGVGTIVGSTVFNTLFIVAVCGLSLKTFLPVSIFPLMRDSASYLLSTIGLLVVLYDKRVFWFETLIFLAIYGLYVLMMFKNSTIEEKCTKTLPCLSSPTETDYHHHHQMEGSEESIEDATVKLKPNPLEMCEEYSLEHRPEKAYQKFLWVASFPIILLFHLMIPRCLKNTDSIVHEIMTFCLSVTALGGLSYILVWMICVLGDTLNIPECVLGMTLLAAGSSIPDVIASVIVVRHGEADMAIANAIGSNVFDTLCLGLPWFIKTSIIQPGYVVEIDSHSMMLSGIILLATVVILVSAFYFNSWRLDRKLGIALLIIYFSIISSLITIELMSCPCNFNF